MKINSIEELKFFSSNPNGDFEDFYISIANGLAKSSKRILYHAEFDEFSIINEIDESYQEVKTHDLSKETLLIEAIEKEKLFKS